MFIVSSSYIETYLWIIAVAVVFISGFIGVLVMKRSFDKELKREFDSVKFTIGPWEEYCRDNSENKEVIDDLIDYYISNKHIDKDPVMIIRNIIESTDMMSTKDLTLGYNETPFRRLARLTDEGSWSSWRDLRSAEYLKDIKLYATCRFLELHLKESYNYPMSTKEKDILANKLVKLAPQYPEIVRDFIYMVVVSLRYDDLLTDYNVNSGLYVNYDCIMWGAKKVMELISDDLAPKQKTKKCSKHYYYKNKKKRRKRNEQKTC